MVAESQQQASIKATKTNDLRSKETKKKYLHFLKTNTNNHCIYCEKELLIKEFKYWMVLENRFPYDKIAEISHMLAPKRHVSGEENLSTQEKDELLEIKKNHLENYSVIIESTPNATTRPDHYHLHLLKYYSN